MNKKAIIALCIFIGLSVLYLLLSLLTFLSRGKWGKVVHKKIAVGSLLISLSLLLGPAAGLSSQEVTSQNTPVPTVTPTPTPDITPMCYVPMLTPAPTPSITPMCYTPPPTITPTPTPYPGSEPTGDVDNNGNINIIDALKVARYVVGYRESDFDASQADVDRSGAITIVDALCIAQKYVGLIEEYPDHS